MKLPLMVTDSYSVSSKRNLKLSLHSDFLKQKIYENASVICKPYRGGLNFHKRNRNAGLYCLLEGTQHPGRGYSN